MIQLSFLSGKRRGTSERILRLPCRIGRGQENELRLKDRGVWNRHAAIALEEEEGFLLTVQSESTVSVNQQPVRKTRLCQGDLIELGTVKLQFWLSETTQHNLKGREVFTWTLIGSVALAQVALVYWIL